MGCGVPPLRYMRVVFFPEFPPPAAEIQTEAIGLSASEVESLVTLNTEELLAGVPGLKAMRSQSGTGMSSVQLVFEPRTNFMRARQLSPEGPILAFPLPNVSPRPWLSQPGTA